MSGSDHPQPETDTVAPTADPGWDLVRSHLAGPPRFEEIAARYEGLLRAWILRRASSLLGFAELDDLVDEVWYQALRRIRDHGADGPTLNTARPFPSWLLGLALNVLKKRVFRPQGVGTLPDYGIDEREVWEAAHEAEIVEAVGACIDELDPRPREICRDIHLRLLTQQEVADRLGCTDANIRNHLAKIRERLRRGLRARGFDPGEDDS